MSTSLRFYFDYISHNAYIAWTQVHTLAARHDRVVEPVPVLFAGLLNAHGQKGPAEIPAKAWWMAKDLLRKSARLGVPLQPPASHPFNPLLSLRASLVPRDADDQRRLIDALFRATWVERQDISAPAVVAAAASAAGLDAQSIVTATQSEEIKQRLRAETDAAIAAGVFRRPNDDRRRRALLGLRRRPAGHAPPAGLLARGRASRGPAPRAIKDLTRRNGESSGPASSRRVLRSSASSV